MDSIFIKGKDYNEEELSYWLAFSLMNGLQFNGVRLINLLEYFGNLTNFWKSSEKEILACKMFQPGFVTKFIPQRKKANPKKLLEQVKQKSILALPFNHDDYPNQLRHIHNPPKVLYSKGNYSLTVTEKPFAIVGTRKPTAYGRRMAKKFGGDLALRGATVISGMAVGVDSLAHWGALEVGGKTIAVLATGVDLCYPSSNRPLYEKLIESDSGLVVSEFFPGTKPERWRFPARNRIIAGLCRGILVVEAGEKSGALITAGIAFEQDRDVFAVPGRLDSEMSKGTNEIIRNQSANFITSVDDIYNHLNWITAPSERKVPTVVELFGREKEVYDFLSAEPVHFDYICTEVGMAAGELSGTLTMLELAGVVERHPGEWFSRIDN